MRIGILSLHRHLYSTQRLVDAAERAGHDVQVVDYLRCFMSIASGKPTVMYRGERLRLDAVVPRIGTTHTFYGTAVVRQFEMGGVISANASEAISRSRDKLRALQLMARAGVGMPVTSMAHSTEDIRDLIKIVGGAPLIVKLIEGTQGVGVVLAETAKAAEAVIAAFRQLDANILVQEYIAEASGTDIRALVVGGRLVAAMMRHASDGDFRANLHRGGHATEVELTQQEHDLAIRAAKTLGLDVAGVDLLRSERGPLVIEVNSSAGLEGIEHATGVNVAGAVIDFLEGRFEQTRRS